MAIISAAMTLETPGRCGGGDYRDACRLRSSLNTRALRVLGVVADVEIGHLGVDGGWRTVVAAALKSRGVHHGVGTLDGGGQRRRVREVDHRELGTASDG